MWHRGVERGAEALDSAWRRADLHQSTCSASARLVNLYSNYVCDFVLFCLVAVVFMCFPPAIYRRGVYGACSCFSFLFSLFSFLLFFRQLTPRDAPPCVCLPLSLFDLIAVPLSLLLHFISLCGALVVLVLVFLSGLSCIAYIVAFFALRVLYVVVLGIFGFCFLAFPSESLPGDDVLCRLFSRPLPSVCLLPFLFVWFCFVFRPCWFQVYFGVISSIL